MMEGGYVKIYRKIWDNPVVAKDPETFTVWLWLLTHATHKERDVVFGKERVTLKAGQLITGRKQIADGTAVNESKITRILNKLKNEQQIEQQTNSRGSLITIVRWSDYQQGEQPSEQQVNSKRTASEQQANTNKNDKNVNKDKNIIYYNARAREGRFDDSISSDEALKRLQALREKIKKGGK